MPISCCVNRVVGEEHVTGGNGRLQRLHIICTTACSFTRLASSGAEESLACKTNALPGTERCMAALWCCLKPSRFRGYAALTVSHTHLAWTEEGLQQVL